MKRYPPVKGIGPHLYSMREESGCSRPQLAERMRVSPGTIKKWENETNALSFSAFLGFAEACGLNAAVELAVFTEVQAEQFSEAQQPQKEKS